MKFNELNAREEAAFRDKLDAYERVPSARARDLFQSRLARKKKRFAGFWVGGMAAALMLVGGWWFGLIESLRVSPIDRTASVVVNLKRSEMKNQPFAQQVIEPMDGTKRTAVIQVALAAENRELSNLEVENDQNRGEEIQVTRSVWTVLPMAGQGPRELEVLAHRLAEVRYTAKIGDVRSGSSRRSASQLFEDLMVLKYGEPVEEGPVLAALFSGEEPPLLAAEREELKERISWIKDKVVR